ESVRSALIGDGCAVAFESFADNFVPADTNQAGDIFLRDCQTGNNTRISVDSTANQGNGHSLFPAMSADGRVVAFSSLASNLVPGDGNPAQDVFVKHWQTGSIARVTVASNGTEANAASGNGGLGSDGRA